MNPVEQYLVNRGKSPRTNGGIKTYTGKWFYPLDPQPEDVDILDIAHALAKKCRFNGHCRKPYSVGQHSVLVSEKLPRKLALVGLLHDAAEAYLPDVCSPIKESLLGFKDLEEHVLWVIFKALGVSMECDWDLIKEVDTRMAYTEGRDLMNGGTTEWQPGPEPYEEHIIPWDYRKATTRFIEAYERLRDLADEDDELDWRHITGTA